MAGSPVSSSSSSSSSSPSFLSSRLLGTIIRVTCLLACLAIIAFLSVSYWALKATNLTPRVEEFRDHWDSCVNQPMGHWVKLAVPSSHRMPCSHIVKAAIKRGEAGVQRGRVLHRLQLKEHPGRDGCAVKYDADVDPWDMHPVPRGKFSYSSCRVEWIIYSSDCGLSMVRMADFAHMAAIPFAVVGVGVPWRGQGGRMRTIRDYLRSLPPDRIVISTDADDAFLMPGPHCRPENLVEAFLSLNAPVAFGGEIFCYPDWRKIEVFYPRKINETKNWFLNSGAYVGYAWALAKIIDATYVGDCMQDQRAYTLGFIGQQYLFRHLPRVPYPEASDFESALSSMGSVTAAVAAQENFADSPFRKPWRNPRPVRYNTTMSPFHRLPPASEEKVISEAMEAGQKDAPSVMAAPFMKLDHYNTLFTHLGGYPWEEFEVVGKGGEAMVRARSTGGMACILHQQGDKMQNLSMYYVFEQARLDYSRTSPAPPSFSHPSTQPDPSQHLNATCMPLNSHTPVS
ncbi:unnamed protein product [Closterium sp. NIES-65]|nr:unnamed protein product [Closterium sp. NIES-65]